MGTLRVVAGVSAVLAVCQGVLAQHYDLRADFDLASNPSPPWAYRWGGAPMRVQLTGLGPMIGPGWGFFASYDASFSLARGDNPAALDWRAGDLVAHAWSGYLGGNSNFFISAHWRSPAPGYVTVSGRTWHADIAPGRDMRWALHIAGEEVAGRGSIVGIPRSSAQAQFANNLVPGGSLGPRPVEMGDEVVWRVIPVPETGVGHFAGVELVVEFCPHVSTEPQSVLACPQTGAVLSLTALGEGPIGYQWQVSSGGSGWVDVEEGTNASPSGAGSFEAAGAEGPVLTASGWSGTVAAHEFRCSMTSAACGVVTSAPSTLSLRSAEDAACVPACDPDYDQNGVADQDDILYLINVVAGGENPTGRDADFDGNGVADQDDVVVLVDVVAGGACP